MKKIFIILILSLFLLSFQLSAQPYEITEIDIFSLGKIPKAEDITVYGVSLKNSFKEALEKFNKKEPDIKYTGKVYSLDIMPDSFRIISIDKKNIDSIILFSEFKNKLKGKTSIFYDLMTSWEFKDYVIKYFGKPDYIYQNYIKNVVEIDKLYYLNGFVFVRFFVKNEPSISMQLISKEKLILEVKEEGLKREAKTREKTTDRVPTQEKIESTTHFRKTHWGMSKERVKKVESSKLLKEEKGSGAIKGLYLLIYEGNIGGLDCAIAYYFAENQLVRARYLIIESHSGKNLYISDFDYIKNQLNEKYGLPIRDDIIWLDDLFKDDPSDYGMAVSVGHLQYVAEWYLPETEIQLLLKGDNYKISLWVEYVGKAFKELEKKVREKAKKDIW